MDMTVDKTTSAAHLKFRIDLSLAAVLSRTSGNARFGFKWGENADKSLSRPATVACYDIVTRGSCCRTMRRPQQPGWWLMKSGHPADRRRTRRRLINRAAKIHFGDDTPERDCLITDISAGGVRLHVEGFEVPDDFVLCLCGAQGVKECNYQVVWRPRREPGPFLSTL